MNYREKIEGLKQKGIFTEEQAARLTASSRIEEQVSAEHERKFTLEAVGVLLMLGAAVYIFGLAGSTERTNTVEDVSQMLNAPVSSGISSQSSFVLIFLLIAIMLYVTLYLYAHNRFRNFWRMAGEIVQLEESMHHTGVMKKELTEKLEILLKDEKQPEAVLNMQADQNTTVHVMKVLAEMEKDLRSQKKRTDFLRIECKQRQTLFPDNLAKLVGKLPTCP